MTPLAIDLFCGLGGWTEGLLAEGYRVIGFDIEYKAYPTQLVIQDVMTLNGVRFKDAALIVASPPCQEFSYMAMPWMRAKKKQARIIADPAERDRLTALFDACFRIQREASEAAGHKIPMVVENVCGAQKWVGRAKWHYGSYYLWGDVPALMPIVTNRRMKFPAHCGPDLWKNRDYPSMEAAYKTTGMNWSNRELRGQDFTRIAGGQAIKNNGESWFNVAHNKESGCGNNPDGRNDGIKHGGDWFSGYGGGFGWDHFQMRQHSSKSPARKQASSMIAKIPFSLARHIAWAWLPRE